jgi:signal transduction histidine kinase
MHGNHNTERLILSSFRAGIVALDLDGTITYINPIADKILERCPLRTGETIHPRAGENTFFRMLSEAVAMNYLPARAEVEIQGRDGEVQPLGFTLSELKEGDRKVGICAFFKDLTQVEMAEESENLTQRLVMLGQMAAGFAHEIRNPIASIAVHCGILRSRLQGQEKLLSSVNMMAKELGKVELIIRECLNFVRPADLQARQVRVDGIVDAVIQRLRGLHPAMEFEVKKPEGAVLAAEVDKGLLEQAIMNITANAAEACGGKGRIVVAFGFARHFIETGKLGRGAAANVEGPVEEEFLRITIRDDGPGIPPDVEERIFIPFFTTKRSGTGLGLPIAQKIVHAHGGILDLKSVPGKGTEFIVKIPLRQKHGE